MIRARLRALAAVAAVATAVLAGTPPAAAAPNPIHFTGLSIDTGHLDVTGGPAEPTLTLTLTDSDTTVSEVMGWVELRQFAAGAQVGAPLRLRYFEALPASGTLTVAFRVPVPRYGTTPEAVWRVTSATAVDGHHERTLRGAALAAYGAEFGVTQLVETDAPALDGVALGPGQSGIVTDSGAGATVDYRVTVTDLPSGFWKGRLVVGGPRGARVSAPFEVAFDGRHLTCGSGSLIDDVYDHVECSIGVPLPAGGAGEWFVARVALTDRIGNTVALSRPAGPRVWMDHG